VLTIALVPVIAGGAVLVQRHKAYQRAQDERELLACQDAFACCLRNKEEGDPQCKWATTHCDDYLSEHDCSEPSTHETAKPPAPPSIQPRAQASAFRLEYAPPGPHELVASWRARVIIAKGSAPPPGTECAVEATFEGATADGVLKNLAITCGEKLLFTTGRKLVASAAEHAVSVHGREGRALRYDIWYEESGFAPEERGRVAVDSLHERAAVWRDASPEYRVELTLWKESAPVTVDDMLLDGGD